MANEWYGYFMTDSVTVAASSRANAVLSVPSGEEFEAHSISIDGGNGAYSIEGITDESGRPYTNASQADPIPSTLLPIEQSSLAAAIQLPAPILIRSNGTLNISFLDTSGGQNIIRVLLMGRRRVL